MIGKTLNFQISRRRWFKINSMNYQSTANIVIKFLHAVFNFCADNYLGDSDQKVLTSEKVSILT